MKKIVLVPFSILAPTPCAKRPMSVARAFTQSAASGPEERWRYSSESPVAASSTAFASSCRDWKAKGGAVCAGCRGRRL